MWKNELERLIKDKWTILIICFLTSLGFISFFITYQYKLEFMNQLKNMPVDVNLFKLKEVISSYNGMKFNIEFFISSDLIELYLVTLLLFLGVFISPQLHEFIESGQENFMISRFPYRKHVLNLFYSQSIYILIINLIPFLILIISGFLIGGFSTSNLILGNMQLNFFRGLLLILMQYLVICLLCILINGISLFSNLYIKNKFIIQFIPFSFFLILPLVISSTIGNLNSFIGSITSYFIPFEIINSLYSISNFGFKEVFIRNLLVPLSIYLTIFLFILKNNIKSFSEDNL